jgi:hypothetical protein
MRLSADRWSVGETDMTVIGYGFTGVTGVNFGGNFGGHCCISALSGSREVRTRCAGPMFHEDLSAAGCCPELRAARAWVTSAGRAPAFAGISLFRPTLA